MNTRAANLQLQGSSLQRKAIKVMTSAFFQVWFNAISSLFMVIFVKYLTRAYTFNSQRRSSYCKSKLFRCRWKSIRVDWNQLPVLRSLWLSTFIDIYNLSIDNYRQVSSTIDLSTCFPMIDFYGHVTSWLDEWLQQQNMQLCSAWILKSRKFEFYALGSYKMPYIETLMANLQCLQGIKLTQEGFQWRYNDVKMTLKHAGTHKEKTHIHPSYVQKPTLLTYSATSSSPISSSSSLSSSLSSSGPM